MNTRVMMGIFGGRGNVRSAGVPHTSSLDAMLGSSLPADLTDGQGEQQQQQQDASGG